MFDPKTKNQKPKTKNLIWLFIVCISIYFVQSCKLDSPISPSHKDQLFNSLGSDDVKDFFTSGFISIANKNIKQSIQNRESIELLDSLLNHLMELQINEPFAEELIEDVGYIVWEYGVIHPQTDSLYESITIPLAGVYDSLTQGVLYSVLTSEGWESVVVSRDTLYSIVGTVTGTEDNVSAFLLSILYFDGYLFGIKDSVLLDQFLSIYDPFSEGEQALIPRGCVVFTTTICFDFPDCIYGVPIGDCDFPDHIPDPFCNTIINESGCQGSGGGGGNGGVFTGSPIGGGGGGSITPSEDPCENLTTINGVRKLCPYPSSDDYNLYGPDFINSYNNLLINLSSSSAAWLRFQFLAGNISLADMISYHDFLDNFHQDARVTSRLFDLYMAYQVKGFPAKSVIEFGNYLLPYIADINLIEEGWLHFNMDILFSPNGTKYLEFLGAVHANIDTKVVLDWAKIFLETNAYEEASLTFATDVHFAIIEIPEIRTDRCEELFDLLKDLESDEELIEPCMPSSLGHPISFWTELTSFTPPPSVLDHVEDSGYKMQFIDDANNPIVNLDYFSISIPTMPKKPNGQTMTDEEFINHFRLNLTSFTPSNWSPIASDNTLWNSSNPLGAILIINIFGDNGGVVSSDHDACCWVFSTVKQPGLFNIVGTHPVSGNRQFGITTENGVKTFFIKGADRSKNLLNLIVGYGPADTFWEDTLENVEEFIKAPAQGGQCSINVADKNRPNWISVRHQLMSSNPITNIGCD